MIRDVPCDLALRHSPEPIPWSFPMSGAPKFHPNHLDKVAILARSFRPIVEIFFRLEVCSVVRFLQPRPKPVIYVLVNVSTLLHYVPYQAYTHTNHTPYVLRPTLNAKA